MARAVRRSGLTLALAGLIGLSTLLHWFAGHRLHGLWIMPDEAIYAARGLAIWRHGSLPLLHGEGAGYGVLYPLFAGLPLSIGSTATGLASLKVVQALVMSLVAVPLVAYGRRIMPPAYTLVAAALALASPLLLYSGLVMTEVLFYPLAALTLLAVARAVETATLRDQAVALLLLAAAVLTRVQAVALVVAFAAAVLLDAALARESSKLRAFWPVGVVVAAGALVAAARPGVVGAYAVTLNGSYPIGAGLRLTADHLAYLILATAVMPSVALVLLLADAARGREPAPAARALVAVTVSTVALVVIQVGFFAGRFAPHLLERDLAALPPLLFLCFALWLSRGPPRSRLAAGCVAFAIAAAIVFAPWNSLIATNALPDTFGIAVLLRLRDQIEPASVVAIFGGVCVLMITLLPRRGMLALPAAALTALVVTSVVAADLVESKVNADQVKLVGVPPNWIDRSAAGDVAYLYDGESYWNGVWQTLFWNDRVRDVVSLKPARVPGPMQQRVVRVPADGRLPISERYVVASDPHQFVGTPVAHLAQNSLDVGGMTLWRLRGAARLSLVETGIEPNGDMTEPGRITVYDCAGGRLEVTLLPKQTRVVTISLDGRIAVRASIAGMRYWNGTVFVPASPTPRVCRFVIDGQTLLGSTQIAFVRR